MPPKFPGQIKPFADQPGDDLESRAQQQISLGEFFKRVDMGNIVEDQEAKNEFIKNITPEEFRKLLVRINGMIRGIPATQRTIDGTTNIRVIDPKTETFTYSPPFQEDKEELLDQALAALKRMGVSQDSAAMLGTAVNAIHPFKDGNGRTSRFLYMTVASSKENLKARDTCPDVLQHLAERYVAEKMHGLPERIPFRWVNDLVPEVKSNDDGEEALRKTFYNSFLFDPEVATSALEIFCKEEGTDFELALLDEKGVFSMKYFLQATKPKMLKRIIDIYRELKKEYVQVIIDGFENPSKYPMSEILPKGFPMREKILKLLPNDTLKDTFYKSTDGTALNGPDFSWDKFLAVVKNEKENLG